MIKKYQPRYNKLLKDDRSFLYIKITEESFPRVYPCRRSEGGFGPYPRSQTVRSVLRALRKIFPFRSCRHLPEKPCLYYDLHLCPGICVFRKKETVRKYKRNIRLLQQVLSGKIGRVIKQLTKEMENESKQLRFEKAADLRNQINDLQTLCRKRHFTSEYIIDYQLITKIRKEEQETLAQTLGIKNQIERIEGYDISHLSGQKATGSMVVFINGVEDKRFYRRFRIQDTNQINDTLMLKETLRRRLKHQEWPLPDLILVDGGKAQVSALKQVLNEKGKSIPLIGLAKREERIFWFDNQNNWKNRLLPFSHPALNLLRRIRDEAHRFAHGYHLKLRREM